MCPNVLLISMVLASNLVLGAHFTCNWIPGSGKPTDDGWRPFCTAPLNPDKVYRCKAGSHAGQGLKVADWDVLAPQVLELCKYLNSQPHALPIVGKHTDHKFVVLHTAATPCGHRGYGGLYCGIREWLICPKYPDKQDAIEKCYGLGYKDDCT